MTFILRFAILVCLLGPDAPLCRGLFFFERQDQLVQSHNPPLRSAVGDSVANVIPRLALAVCQRERQNLFCARASCVSVLRHERDDLFRRRWFDVPVPLGLFRFHQFAVVRERDAAVVVSKL